MRRIKILLLFIAVFFFSGCGPSDQEAVTDVSQHFLTYYLQLNYLDAVSFCTDELAAELVELYNEFDEESDEVKQRISDASKGSTFQIVASELDSSSNTAHITYNLFPPETQNSFVKHLILLKSDRIWKISAID